MDPFLGEIRIFAGNFPPKGWAFCDGRLMPLSQNTALFSLLGTQYGGDGKTTFALPDLRGSAPMHHGQGPGLTQRNIGAKGGSATVTLETTRMPAHNHLANCATTQTAFDPTQAVWANSGGRGGQPVYSQTPSTPMSPMALSPQGGSQPHNNMQPYLGLNFIIALEGIFPPRN